MGIIGDGTPRPKPAMTVRERASWMLRLPTKLLTLFAGGAVENLVANHMTVLRRQDLEVLLHPTAP